MGKMKDLMDIEQFNNMFPVGTDVFYVPTPESKPQPYKTQTAAFIDKMSMEPCVMLEGSSGVFPLSKIRIAIKVSDAGDPAEKPSRFVTTSSGYEIDLKAVVAAKKQQVMAPNKDTDFKWWPQVAGLVIVGAIHLKSEDELNALHDYWKQVRLDD